MILVKNLKGVSKCTAKGKTDWIVHVKGEYDYQFDGDNRDDVIAALKYVFHQINSYNLPIYHIPEEL